jgi:hypothetical protein
MDGYKQNSLKAAFGLEPITPNEQFYRNPCAETISDIPKSFQTEEMVLLALNGETTMHRPVSRSLSSICWTRVLCGYGMMQFFRCPIEVRCQMPSLSCTSLMSNKRPPMVAFCIAPVKCSWYYDVKFAIHC